MSINRYNPILTDYGNGEELEHWYHPEGEFVYYEDHIKETERKTQSLLDEITSLKTELATLMSSLETWDEEFK